tara:strand:+ start:19432 stop:19986 length:555 start_codon:yes stop_codon:yes gene_type:complete
MELSNVFIISLILVIILTIIFIIIIIVKKKTKSLYKNEKKVSVPYDGMVISVPKHLPTLKFEYKFDMIVHYSGGSKKDVVLLNRNQSSKFIINMDKGSLDLLFHRDPLNTENIMKIKTLSIIPFQKRIKLEIKQDLRNIEVCINGSSVHIETLDFIPFTGNENVTLLPEGASHWVYVKEFDFKV